MPITKKALIQIIALLFPIIIFAATRYADIPYYPEGEAPNPEKNLLDVYLPEGAVNVPVFFRVHGMNDYQPTDTVIVPGSHSTELVDLISHPGSRIRRELVAFIEEVLGTNIEASNAVNTIDRFEIFCYSKSFNASLRIRVQKTEPAIRVLGEG